MHSATVIPRRPMHFAPRCAAVFLAPAAVACFVLAACSPGADYPSLFPSVHDIPAPRTDTPLDSNQVQQATEDLISARDRLSAEAQSAQGKHSTSSPGKPAAKSVVKSSVKSSANPTAALTKQPSNQVSGRQGTDTEQTAGAETK